jgi:hypothetical protein
VSDTICNRCLDFSGRIRADSRGLRQALPLLTETAAFVPFDDILTAEAHLHLGRHERFVKMSDADLARQTLNDRLVA